MSFIGISAGIGAVATGYDIYKSAKKNSAANKIAESTKRPVYNAPHEINDTYNLSLADANDTQEQDFAGDLLGQNEANGIDAILKSGGKADFGVIHGTYGSQLKSLLADVRKNKAAKMAAVYNAAYNNAQAKDAEFSYNLDAPFKDNKQKEGVLRQEGAQYEADAFKTASQGVANYATAKLKPGEYGDNASSFEGVQGRVVARADIPGTPNPTAGRRTLDKPLVNPNISLPPAASTNADFMDDGTYIIGYDEYNQPIYSR